MWAAFGQSFSAYPHRSQDFHLLHSLSVHGGRLAARELCLELRIPTAPVPCISVRKRVDEILRAKRPSVGCFPYGARRIQSFHLFSCPSAVTLLTCGRLELQFEMARGVSCGHEMIQ